MRIVVVGSGYVGLVSGACFAEMGNEVVCIDTNAAKIEGLRRGMMPIFEPGLEDMVARNVRDGRLSFGTSLAEALRGGAGLSDACAGALSGALSGVEGLPELIFSAVGTPPGKDSAADLSQVMEVARTVGRHATAPFVLVTKSTVPVGTAARVRAVVAEELAARGLSFDFDVASNPEFLKEGAAIKDFMSPDRVVVGVESERARALMERLYKPFMLNGLRIIWMDIPSAEMTKYAANAMLAARISFMNEMALLCEAVGADVEQVRRGIGSDVRIGNKFLYAGAGYGGSCFPKDIKALVRTGAENGVELSLISAVERVNERQKHVVFNKLRAAFSSLSGRVVAVWGLAFKPETDDVREAPALVLVRDLLAAGATVRVYDPVVGAEQLARAGGAVDVVVLPSGSVPTDANGSSNGSVPTDADGLSNGSVPTDADGLLGDSDSIDVASAISADRLIFCKSAYDAASGADAIALMTEWREFRTPDWALIRRSMHRGTLANESEGAPHPIIIDGRNIYDPAELRAEGFNYHRIGVRS